VHADSWFFSGVADEDSNEQDARWASSALGFGNRRDPENETIDQALFHALWRISVLTQRCGRWWRMAKAARSRPNRT